MDLPRYRGSPIPTFVCESIFFMRPQWEEHSPMLKLPCGQARAVKSSRNNFHNQDLFAKGLSIAASSSSHSEQQAWNQVLGFESSLS
ncbi:hypothetical protein AVEN_15553-1 [Araneus ventricosus]|uniref:Uncharacterized protein n=1 Tax=Araneus ventricosus TaxID=182803 RepID=A0A4Y2FSI8_ARAVE|nr:hypothetical protein AVEN_15553-1 [Araneus ventricosus]